MATHTDFVVFFAVNTTLNVVSLVSGLAVVVMILVGRKQRPTMMNRVSIRFTLAISAVDAVRAVSFLIYAYNRDTGFICTLLSYSNQSLTLMYLFLTASIAANLQLAFINHTAPKQGYLFWCVSVLAALVLPALPMAAGRLGFDPKTHTCEYKDSTSIDSFMWLWATFLGWVVLSCVYCTVVVSLTTFRLKSQSAFLTNMLLTKSPSKTPEQLLHLRRSISKLAIRVSLYCMIPLATQSTHIVMRIYEYYDPIPSLFTAYLSAIPTELPGLLNLIAFLLDPAFTNTLPDKPSRQETLDPVWNCHPVHSDSDSSTSSCPLLIQRL
ncbi:hypothetical protein DSO57_1031427 [Entomophthora muscae]|uniref:Uncharacterized protein n=1 Tax=Entomophthora muscae TaxID=34485 RepID=A0ACC2TYK2_9FUNG|nr:hypothetical protein DSO57_1031427 [Entomophthora muscae]